MSEELKPCPFCGGDMEIISHEGRFYLFCCKMISRQRSYSSKQWAIKTCNTRTPDPRIAELQEALERAHEELTKNPEWPDTRREHEISEIIEQALKETVKPELPGDRYE